MTPAWAVGLWLAAALPAPKPPPDTAPLQREASLEQAARWAQAGRRLEAVALLRRVADRFDSVRALLMLARLQAAGHETRAALASLRRARELAPDSEEVLGASAQASLAAGRPLEALGFLEPLTRIAPEVPEHHSRLGVCLVQLGDFARAAESLERARSLEPDHPLTLIALGLALNGLKRYPDARPVLERALELQPDDVEGLAALAESEEGLGDEGAAEDHAERALAKAAGHGRANLVLGMLRLKQERHAEARDALRRAVAADPGSPKAHYQLSLALARLGDDAGARAQRGLYEARLADAEARLKRLRGEGAGEKQGMHP